MEIHLKLTGILLILLACIHMVFPRYFKWREQFVSLSLINRQMMMVHTFFIALTVFLMGLLCFTSAPEIIDTPLGRKIALGLGVFWSVRFFIQLFVYSSKLWKGKMLETTIHVVFSLLWIYFSVVFFSVVFLRF